MEQIKQSRLASVLTVVLGMWIMLSPLFISITGGALASLLVTGGIMIVFGLVQLPWENSLPSWLNMIAAVWLFIAAFAFSVSTAAMWDQALSAIVVFVIATWDGVEVAEVQHLHHLQSSRHHAM
ncbi:MAG TPA: hypothetical protein VMB52_02965 [Verrucomicrobiae bacterium]|nr:hypothetical protein [Verrucomicrobiae bacterium]